MKNDHKGKTKTPEGATIEYATGQRGANVMRHLNGLPMPRGYYYNLAGTEGRNLGPFPTRAIAERWHEAPSDITDADIAAIRKVQGYK